MKDSQPTTVLLVEDEEHLSAGIKLNFGLEGYKVLHAASSREAAGLLLQHPEVAVIVLDVMLPDIDGFTFCQNLRTAGQHVPVLMLTARDELESRIKGLEAGADDYLTKPFELRELLARVSSLLRRRQWEQRQLAASGHESWVKVGAAKVNFEQHRVVSDGQDIHLTALEFELLRYFVSHQGRALSRQELQERVWRVSGYDNARMVDNFVMRLRRRFEANPSQPQLFLSIRGTGYKYVSAEPS